MRHRIFILTRLSIFFTALACIPFFLVAGGVPRGVHAAALAWLVVPLIAAVRVSSTGRLADGEWMSAAAWVGLAITLVLGRVCGAGTAVSLLIVLLLEAGLYASVRRATVVSGGVVVAAALLLAVAGAGIGDPTMAHAADPAAVLFAVVYGAGLAHLGLALRRTSEREARVEADRTRALSEAVGDLVLRFTRSGAVLLGPERAARTFGIDTRDLAGRGFFERVHVADRPAFLKLMSDAAGEAFAVTARMRLRVSAVQSEDGRFEEPVFLWIEITARACATQDDRSVLAALRDMSAQVRHEAEIERVARDAEQASAWKDAFLATVSHELRTPLNAIIGFSEILGHETQAPSDAEKRRDYARIVHESGRHLLSVVNGLLDMSKIEAGKFELTFEPFDVTALVDSCCDMMRLRADQGRTRLVRDIAPGLPVLNADERACKQVLLNLLSNALKFTPDGGTVTVAAAIEGDNLVLVVSDTGIGMQPPDLARLGDPFFQARQSYDRPFEGTGLGLSVVSGLVGLHGGTIAADSAPGEGLRIAVRLPRLGCGDGQQTTKAKIDVLPRAAARTTPPSFTKVQKIA